MRPLSLYCWAIVGGDVATLLQRVGYIYVGLETEGMGAGDRCWVLRWRVLRMSWRRGRRDMYCTVLTAYVLYELLIRQDAVGEVGERGDRGEQRGLVVLTYVGVR